MLDTLEKGVNIKNLSLEAHARAERRFDPKDWITEEDWHEITGEFDTHIERGNVSEFLQLLAPIKIIDPARVDSVPNIDRAVAYTVAGTGGFNPDLGWLEVLARLKIISPDAIPPRELDRLRQLTQDSLNTTERDSTIGGLRKFAAAFTVFPEIRDRVEIPKDTENQVNGQIRFWKQPHLKAFDGVAETIMVAKIVKPDMRYFDINHEDKKSMIDYFQDVRKHKNWRMTLSQGMFLKGVYADRIETTEKGLQFVTNPPKFGVESALPKRRNF